jgi:nitrate/nitrite-specific signal transduction histidine kinase
MLALQQERDSAQNEAYQAQITARHTAENWTEALVTINRRIVAMEDVDEILLYIVENARALLRADFAGLALCREDHSALDLRCFSTGDRTQLVTQPEPVTNSAILQLVQDPPTCRSLRFEGASPLEGAAFFVSQPAKALGAVCISLDGVSIGALWVARGEEHPFAETDLIWLECLADQIEIAIKHGLMTSQLQSLSIAEERGRIAREMHDGLAQVLGYLNLEVQTLEALLAQGKLDPMRRELDQMHAAVQNANADVRESILSLRTTLSNKEGLIASIADYLDEFGLQAGVNTHFLNELQGESDLASVAEVQLVCIMQEALTNVRKHAHAGNVWVKLTQEMDPAGDSVVLLVSDDGIGFEAIQSKLSFGLQTMRERAQGVNGELEVRSTPGKGTTVLCRMPTLRVEPMETTAGAGQARPAVSVSAESGGTRSIERA